MGSTANGEHAELFATIGAYEVEASLENSKALADLYVDIQFHETRIYDLKLIEKAV